jgi:insertion element IS1 protein InsB
LRRKASPLSKSKTYMTCVEGENTSLRHYPARFKRKTFCYSKSLEMLKYSIKLLVHYLKFWDIAVPYRREYCYSKQSHFY